MIILKKKVNILFITKKEELEQVKNPKVDEAVKKNCCTFVVSFFYKNKITGPNFSLQKWYFCKTCGLDNNKGCCQSCANTCHKGHELSEAKYTSCKFLI